MKFLTAFQDLPHILFDAPVESRMQYEKQIPLPDTCAAHLIYDEKVMPEMAELYAGDIAIAQQHHLPIILTIPTYRASLRYLQAHGYNDAAAVTRVNKDCSQLVEDIKSRFTEPTADIFCVGPIGPKNDAYAPELKVSEDEAADYHATQIAALADTRRGFY